MKFLLVILFGIQLCAQSFEKEALDRINKDFPEYEKIELQFITKLSPDEKIVMDYTRKINLLRGTALIPVIATKGLKTSASVVSFKVQVYKKVLVALKDFDKKQTLTRSGLEEKVIDVTIFNGTPVTNSFEFSNYRSKSIIKKGEVIISEKIEKIPLINAGDKVTAEVRNGSVILTTEAYARQQGSYNDLIEVVSANNKIIKARIVDTNKVIVE